MSSFCRRGAFCLRGASWWSELRGLFKLRCCFEEVPSSYAKSCVLCAVVRVEARRTQTGGERFASSAAQPAHPGGECRRELAYRRTTRVQVTSIGLVGLVRSARLHAT